MVSLTLEISRILQVDYSRNNYEKQAAIPSGVAATHIFNHETFFDEE
ncbi:hypothetical protein [Butyrivibrio sp. AC2005]|nr:hypothetical protein [Butyrivibrio sp. AC2005]